MNEIEHKQHAALCDAELTARAAKDAFRAGSAEWLDAVQAWFAAIRARDSFRVDMSAQGKAYCSPLRVIFKPL